MSLTNNFFSIFKESDKEVDMVIKHIYLGSINAANNKEWIKTNNIKNILGLIGYQDRFMGINYLTFNDIGDTPEQNIIKYFYPCFKFIDNAINKQENVLVHCHAGISRSSTIVMAYLMYKYGYSLEKALNLTKSSRRVTNPNKGFLLQLKVFEKLSDEEKELFFKY